MSQLTPALFVGHGSPMNALQDNPATQAMQEVGADLEPPKAVVVFSAHWQAPETLVLCNERPGTLYDFYGFPPELYNLKYPADGATEVAGAISKLLSGNAADACGSWGFDHGSWVVLTHLFPDSDIPVTQVSLDFTKHPKQHYEMGRYLAPLRSEGVLFVGSGNIVHNLSRLNPDQEAKPVEWAVEFDSEVKSLIDHKDHKALIDYQEITKHADLCVPTNEHYLPLLCILGMQQESERVRYPHEGFQHGSVSMRSLVVEAAN